MSIDQIIFPLVGGGLIGLAVTIMLYFNGRVTGISGIISSSMTKPTSEGLWRWMFLVGLLLGGFVIQRTHPELLVNLSNRTPILVVAAGFLVGFGTIMGSGCTSGHGVCGISRFSIRSLIATVTFMAIGFLAVQLVNFLLGGAQ